MRNPVQPFLEQFGFFVLDGALASEMERRGADLNDPLWSAKVLLESPELIRQVSLDYFLAGADISVSSTYQATFEGFAKRGLSADAARRLFHQSVRLIQEARDAFWAVPASRGGRLRPLVGASVGPYGAYLANGAEYTGDYDLSESALADFHRPRMVALAESEPDLFCFETIPSFRELNALVNLLSEFPDLTAWMSFSTAGTDRLADGTPFQKAVEVAARSPQIIAVGVNCLAPQNVLPLLRLAAEVTDKPLLAYPNSGEKWDAANHCWLPADETADFGMLARQWFDAGARLIGGCCRTSMKEIAQIRAVLSQIQTA
ncbi:MAG: homocysteine S-methyltransferase [Bacteroidetes bacterium]|nr:MAG: homocysteine S-methyltransferase [Bacteroidota bacterium]